MKIIYDPYADALSISFREGGRIKKTVEIAPEMMLDLDEKSRPLYLEILGAKEKLGRAATEEISMKNLVFGNNKSAKAPVVA
ncbi:DUF2283 domain-containing protein [Candidatus Parcubacteria bacterium]|nr:DUF2283 domain-containing protein [Candidatus Parcubacteria bacterium]